MRRKERTISAKPRWSTRQSLPMNREQKKIRFQFYFNNILS